VQFIVGIVSIYICL